MKIVLLVAVCVFVVCFMGCGGAAKYAASPSYAPAQEAEAAPPPEPGAAGAVSADAAYDFDDGAIEGNLAESAKASEESVQPSPVTSGGVSSTPVSQPVSEKSMTDREPTETGAVTEPMVMYSGFLKFRVKRLLEALDTVTQITEEKGGYVESMTGRVIVVRIPRGDFEAAMDAFRVIGELLDRRVTSRDVTEQYTDLQGRLAVAREARERLLKLLDAVKDVEERLHIMREIKRLTEQIETIESQLDTLKNLVDYFTITIELVPVLEQTGAETRQSPFPWIRHLEAHLTTLEEGKETVTMRLPKKFVLFDDDDTYRAQAADTTIIRAGVVENEPLGDNRFWSDAVQFEMEGRREILVETATTGPLTYRLYRNDDVTVRYYLVGVSAVGRDLYVVEVFYPNESAMKAHHASVVDALKTFEVK